MTSTQDFEIVDPNSGILAPIADTRTVGMAASLASLIGGQDVISDAEALKMIAAEHLGHQHVRVRRGHRRP